MQTMRPLPCCVPCSGQLLIRPFPSLTWVSPIIRAKDNESSWKQAQKAKTMRPKEPQPTNPSPQKSLVTKNFAHKNRPFSHHPPQMSLPHNFPMPKITLPKSLSRRITLTHKSIAPKISIPKNFAPIISIPNKILPKWPYPEIPPTLKLPNPKVLNPPTHMSLPLNTRNPKITQLKTPYPTIPTTHKSLLLKFYPPQTIAPKIPRANYSRAPVISRTLHMSTHKSSAQKKHRLK